jgi:hypothetical protein
LFLAARVAGGQLADRSVHVGLAPQLGGTVVEEVKVMGVVAFLLHDLELDVLVVKIRRVGFAICLVGKTEVAEEEEAALWLEASPNPYSYQ